MIAIIDYGSGNVGAIANIYKQLRIAHVITSNHDELAAADRYVLPGVGDFDATMRTIRSNGMVDVLNRQILQNKKKVLGICVGMQVLAESSEEGELAGLGWVPARVRRINAETLKTKPKLPHMGWNSVRLSENCPLFEGVDQNRGFYFLHSYFFEANEPSDVVATVSYGTDITCGVIRNNVYGLQFHPEKSHANGMTIFRNFASL
jgi:imidazole glycerol-phosphate synthase subunit HisH